MKAVIVTLILGFLGLPLSATKPVKNYPYVHSDLGGIYYARCIPAEDNGSKGSTKIYKVRKDQDELVDEYDWYCRSGLILGWSPRVGKVAVMTKGQSNPKANDKQEEFSFYLGGTLLKTYTTEELVEMGAELRLKRSSPGPIKRADIKILGCEQIPKSNDYVFVVQVNRTKVVRFDILTGKPFHGFK